MDFITFVNWKLKKQLFEISIIVQGVNTLKVAKNAHNF